ncbi:MAG: hypothetical protein Pg6A_15740 [Termitinemataceae bacterium]|nr:MAG: hypothetical protein Pg6A_15740 [Termitinemataceae bacterium]
MTVSGWQVNDNILEYFTTLSLGYKKESPKMFAHLLNDMAFSFRNVAPKILANRYTIRNQRFVQQQFFVVKKATPNQDILNIEAIISSNYIANKYGSKHTGWSEELGEQETRSAYWTKAARGGSRTNSVLKKYIPQYAKYGGYGSAPEPPTLSDLTFGLSRERQIPAFIKSIQLARRVTHGRYNKAGNFKGYRKTRKKGIENPAFATQNIPLVIIDRNGAKTLSHFKGDDIMSGRLEALKVYKQPNKKISIWSWDDETIDKVQSYFRDEYIIEKYITPIFSSGNLS